MADKFTQLEIKMLGEFDILVDNRSVLNQLTRLPIIIELLQYMIANYDKELLPSTIAEDIWPDKDYQDTNKVLRTYIYRLKKFLSGSNSLQLDISGYITVTNIRGRYKLLVSDECVFDIRLFDTKCKNMDTLLKNTKSIDDLKPIVSIYKGDFLKNTLYTHWAIPLRNLYLDKFCKLINIIIKDYYDNGKFKEVIKYCEQIFEIYDLDEVSNIYFLKSLMQEERINDALQHYSYITSKMYNELSIKPSPELKEVYNLLKKPDLENTSEEKQLPSEVVAMNSVQNLFMKKLPRTMRNYKLDTAPTMALGLFQIKKKSNQTVTQSESNGLYNQLKVFLDIILLKDYSFSVISKDTFVIFLRDIKEDFISVVSEQINNYILKSFDNELTFQFSIRVISPGSKNIANFPIKEGSKA
ncbi:MAG: hypothetical protein LBV08_09990 [Clostridiales bacterium]|jgi:two-component SAPR family response regulator|nr:hypothetical protein [Clostridiales bacterium]